MIDLGMSMYFYSQVFLDDADCEMAPGCSVAPKKCEEKLHNPVLNQYCRHTEILTISCSHGRNKEGGQKEKNCALVRW